MHKLLVAGFMSTGIIMQAWAANTEDYQPEMKAYVNFGFGAPQVQSLGLHYGFRMDHDLRYQAEIGRIMPALMQLDFTAAQGFDSALINGQPFLKRNVQMNQDGDPGASPEGTGSDGGMFGNFTVMDWSLVAVGVVGVGFGISQVAKTSESPDPKSSTSSGSTSGGTLPVIGGQCLPGTPLCAPLASTGGYVIEIRDANYDEWLNADYGHMGDLYKQ